MSAPQPNDAEKNIEIWKVKKLIKRLEAARGNGTSMISLIIPPKDQVSRAAKMLAEEFGTASNIKSRVNRLSVLSAITSTQQRLKLYSKVPPNGLVVYCGEIITSEGKERKINIDFEPFKPINTSLYLCDNKFHTEALSELLDSDQKFGFIIMDGNGALFGTLSGNTREVVQKFSVDLPKKHGRGGQSALRFARLREEKRHNYVRKVAELAVQNFITNDKVNVSGLILAGSADFKNDLNQSDLFDNRLAVKVIKVVDVSYGGENGFNQAIELSAETLSNVKFIQEKKLINAYFDEISQDTGKVCYGIEDTLKALELGACETLIVFENLEITRWTVKSSTGAEVILHTNKIQEQNREIFMDKETGQEMEVVDQMPFLEWLAEKYQDFGATLEFVSDRSSEGNQFVKGFGGIGAMLRYKVNFEQLQYDSDEDEFYDSVRGHPSRATSSSSDGASREGSRLGRCNDGGSQYRGFSRGAHPRPVVSESRKACGVKATLQTYPPSEGHTLVPQSTIKDVFTAVQTAQVERGVVPYENSTNGSVIQTLDLFADIKNENPSIRVCGEALVPVQHCLLGHLKRTGRPENGDTSIPAEQKASSSEEEEAGDDLDFSRIRKLYSHPQAWTQCTPFLTKHLSHAKREDTTSTSQAADLVSQDRSGRSAAICSKLSAELYGLDILVEGIEEKEGNTTKFLVLRREPTTNTTTTTDSPNTSSTSPVPHPPPPYPSETRQPPSKSTTHPHPAPPPYPPLQGPPKSLLTFTVPHSDPGALGRALGVFGRHGINLTSMHTRPSGERAWHYLFFVELEAARGDPGVEVALGELGGVVEKMRGCGSWRGVREG
ncbi:hypothetical protein FKW77_007607 [Venturia effusa]|uniref:prephenate dehydratase n=1 Tax=Venturia effusa TaxID=50376 RepID=A0A517L3U0_9PEZI|nr:hypothetical protein FKW77_007607 [Venturia effusa]